MNNTSSRRTLETAIRYWEDVKVGNSLGPLSVETSVMQLVEYAGASRDFNIIHHDRDYARSVGLPDIIIQGSLKAAFLGRLVDEWMGRLGQLRRLGVQYRGVDIPGEPVSACGVVKRKFTEGAEGLVECEVWVESMNGDRSTIGTAIVSLPMAARR
jgi:acyl dehydratase